MCSKYTDCKAFLGKHFFTGCERFQIQSRNLPVHTKTLCYCFLLQVVLCLGFGEQVLEHCNKALKWLSMSLLSGC